MGDEHALLPDDAVGRSFHERFHERGKMRTYARAEFAESKSKAAR